MHGSFERVWKKIKPESARGAHPDFTKDMGDGFFQNRIPHFLDLPYTARADFTFDDIHELDNCQLIARFALGAAHDKGGPRYVGMAFADSRTFPLDELTAWLATKKFNTVYISTQIDRFGEDTKETVHYTFEKPDK